MHQEKNIMSYRLPEWFKKFTEQLEEANRQEQDEIKASEDK